MGNLAPVIVFIYNRYKTTIKTMSALKENILAKDTEVFVFSDGPKADKENDEKEIKKIRKKLKKFAPYFKRFEVIEHKENVGINDNIIPGITEIINRYGKAIIIEDDIVTAKNFLSFMNKSLEYYKEDEEVFSICGYNPVTSECKLPGDSFSYDVFWCWGWATWANRWNTFHYEDKTPFLIDHIKAHSDSLIYGAPAKYDVLCPKNKTHILWDYKVACRQLAEKKTVIYPKKSLSDNIGMDNTGVTSGYNEGYCNKNFNRKDTNEIFDLSKENLNIMTDPEYYFKFRYQTYAMDIYFNILFQRDALYRNMYCGMSELYSRGGKIRSFFEDNNIEKVALYGWGEAGQYLYELLQREGIKVSYVLDRKPYEETDISIITDFENAPPIDMVIVTALRDFTVIQENIYKYFECPIVCIDDVVACCVQKL